ncbi:poly(R)-hydroxyalkanoic acid synthase [Natronococcus pandeyae]|uniref:Poly(R)-hydroxyalkanoic acid synthase n=1 Tax=Natronococcus pandeyae TaxID=2055836 RepID=A0A8J8TQD8_9EURY|nr:alpha/beta fold hydrolase [Natronococcus pandeyae]TYL38781.1 poly(R)-hydroxyalkanoic acid synthase [Natronococcus pandeyae]
MDPCEFSRQVANRTARTPRKLGQAPYRTLQLTAAEPGETPYDVIYEESPVRLRRYEPEGEQTRDVPVLIAYAFINDPSILDFSPERTVVGTFLERGFPVYVVDWGDPSPIDRSLTLGDYVTRFLANCVDVVCETHATESVHLLGYSTSAPLAAAYAALFPDRVRTLVLQGPPLDFDTEAGMDLFRALAAEHDPEQVADAFDAVPTPLLEVAFALRKPVEYTVTTPLRLWDQLDDDEFVEEQGRKLEWTMGGPNLPATTYREFVEELLVENRLLENEWRLCGRRVDLSAIEMPVLLVLGEEDKFVPREASVPFLDEIESDDTAIVELPTGHVGLSVAEVAHEQGWPRIADWLEERSS